MIGLDILLGVLLLIIIGQWAYICKLRHEDDNRRSKVMRLEKALELSENIINKQADTILDLELRPPIHQPRVVIQSWDNPEGWERCF